MKPIDLRNANFARLREELTQARKDVYTAWLTFGPGTTREVAEKSGIDLLTFRPRTTDLYQVGLVELCHDERSTEGVYQAVPEERWEAWRQSILNPQMQLI